MGRGAEKPKLRFLHWMDFYRFANAYPNCIKSQEKFLAFIVLLMLLKITKNERLGHNQSKNYFYRPLLYRWGSSVLRLQNHCKETVYFLPRSPQDVLVLIWSALDGWKAESILELPRVFECGIPGFWIQGPNH